MNKYTFMYNYRMDKSGRKNMKMTNLVKSFGKHAFEKEQILRTIIRRLNHLAWSLSRGVLYWYFTYVTKNQVYFVYIYKFNLRDELLMYLKNVISPEHYCWCHRKEKGGGGTLVIYYKEVFELTKEKLLDFFIYV